jgi:hypothetical protein
VRLSQKAAVSLLIATALVAVFSTFSFISLFDLIEVRFYRPAIAKARLREAARDARLVQVFLAGKEQSFSETLNQDAVRRSLLPSHDIKDALDRSRMYGLLIESHHGLHAVRFVAAQGNRIHFSTNPADILGQDEEERAVYRDYAESPSGFYDVLSVPDQGEPKLTFDQWNGRIIFSFPVYDSMDVYHGTALYYLSAQAVADMLVMNGRLRPGEDMSLVSSPPGIVLGLSPSNKDSLLPLVASVWARGGAPAALDSGSSPASLVLVSAKTERGVFTGMVSDADLFRFPQAMKLILLFAFALTVYLTVFLCFNLRVDSVTVVQNRLKNLKFALLKEYHEHREDMLWDHWRKELESRRKEVQTELTQGIKAKDITDGITVLIDKSWDELLSALGGRVFAGAEISGDAAFGDDNKSMNTLRASADAGVMAAGESYYAEADAAPPQTAPSAEDEEIEELEPLEELEALDEDEGAPPAQIQSAPGPAPQEQSAATEAAPGAPPLDLEAEIAAAEADLIARPRKRSNVKLVFGDDDIPYIVESSGLELVDEEIKTLSRAAPVSSGGTDEEAEEIEELEAIEEAEELEELEEAEAPAEGTESGGTAAVAELEELTEPGVTAEHEELEALEEAGPGTPEIVFPVAETALPDSVEYETAPESETSPFAASEMLELEMFDPLEDAVVLEEGGAPSSGAADGEIPAKPDAPADAAPRGNVFDLEEIARRIEFDGDETDDEDEEEGQDNLEIVSPFAAMLSRLETEKEAAPDTPEDAETAPPDITPEGAFLAEVDGAGMFLFYTPFLDDANAVPECIDAEGPVEIIREEGGVSYISDAAIKPGTNPARLDPGLKELVDSVIKNS